MSTTAVRSTDANPESHVSTVDMKLEVVTLPVSDFDRSKEFYTGLGWRLDADFRDGNDRAIQFTPPGSGCSIHFSTKGTPGSAQGLFLVVSDIEAARDELVGRGAEVSSVFHFAKSPAPFGDPVGGPAPDHGTYGSTRRSATQTATAGCFRRSRPGSPAGWPAPPRTRQSMIFGTQ